MSILSTTGPERQNSEFSQGFIIFFHSLDSCWITPKQKSPTWKKAAKISFQKLKTPVFSKQSSLPASFRCSAKLTLTSPGPSHIRLQPRCALNLDPTWDRIWILFCSRARRKTDSRWNSQHFFGPGAAKRFFFFFFVTRAWALSWILPWFGQYFFDLTGTMNFTISIKFHHFCWNFVSSEDFQPAFLTAKLRIWLALAVFLSTV